MVPVVAPAGTVATNLVVVAEVIVAEVPLNFTAFAEMVDPKLEPLIVTDVPGGPLGGVKLVMDGFPPAHATLAETNNAKLSPILRTRAIHVVARWRGAAVIASMLIPLM